jgi:tetratricopeptide (TPR) repeat protein
LTPFDQLRKGEEALELLGQSLPANHPDFLRRKRQLAEAYADVGLLLEARAMLNETRAAQTESIGIDAPDTLDTAERLADILLQLGQFDLALGELLFVVDARVRTLGASGLDSIRSRWHLGVAYDQADHAGESIQELTRAYESLTARLGTDDDETVDCQVDLGVALSHAGRETEAVWALRQALHREESSSRHLDSERHAGVLTTLGAILREGGEPFEAIDLLEQAHSMLESLIGNSAQRTIDAGVEVALALLNARVDDERALLLLNQDLRSREVAIPEADSTIRANLRVARALLTLERYAHGAVSAREAEARLVRRLGTAAPAAPLWYETRKVASEALSGSSDTEAAVEILESTLMELERTGSTEASTVIDCGIRLAWALAEAGHDTRAIDTIHDALDLRSALGPAHPDVLSGQFEMAMLYREIGRFGEAIDIFEETLRLQVWVLGVAHADTLKTQELLARTRELASGSP